MKQWNDKILGNASDTVDSDPIGYIEDGGLEGSGVLDVAREMKLRVKNWAYAYHLTNETKYADRVFLELQVSVACPMCALLTSRLLRETTPTFLSARTTALDGIRPTSLTLLSSPPCLP